MCEVYFGSTAYMFISLLVCPLVGAMMLANRPGVQNRNHSFTPQLHALHTVKQQKLSKIHHQISNHPAS